MLEFVSSVADPGAELRTAVKRADVHWPSQQVRCLAPGEILFQTGDLRGEVYCVERGSLCHYTRWRGGRYEIIECLFSGDILGFGHIAPHVSTARAMQRTEVRIVTPDELEFALRTDGELAARVAATGEREFDYLRFGAMEIRTKPAQRLASLLVALSCISAQDGRDAARIPDEILSRAVSEALGLSVDDLGAALRELQGRELVVPSDDELRIVNIPALERFADASTPPTSSPPYRELKVSGI